MKREKGGPFMVRYYCRLNAEGKPAFLVMFNDYRGAADFESSFASARFGRN